MNRMNILMIPALLLGGCVYDEGLVIENMNGTVVLPAAAGERTFAIEGGANVTNDVRNIGPVYLGLYPSVKSGAFSYPYPETGPIIGNRTDTYPYGGTTIGDHRYSCIYSFRCKVVSGRYVDFDSMVDWFSDTLGEEVVDAFGNPINNGALVRQICYDELEVTSDAELRLTVTEDRNGDGNMDEGDLDFVLREDGNYEAKFTIWQQEYFEGFSLWGFMERPNIGTNDFDTCDISDDFGYNNNTYNQDWFQGRQAIDALNFAADYLERGDWVAGEQDDGNLGYIYQDVLDEPELWLNTEVQ